MTRIISGDLGGRRLRTPSGQGTRPTSDRVREALFSALAARGVLQGAHVMDLYAGSGALGLEAASRGAASVLLVELDKAACGVIRGNIADLGVSGARVVAGSVEAALNRTPTLHYDLVLADPPYDVSDTDLGAVLEALIGNDWLAEGGLVVVERSSRSTEPQWPMGLSLAWQKNYGETQIWVAELASVETDSALGSHAAAPPEAELDR